ncbi:MAG: LL-diaminopimelate aminotransferase [Clostridia bacterium]|nr:LL-diaminopimelate aminotransferase [Clostridia bacterium]
MNIKLNRGFSNLGSAYLFSEIAARVNAFKRENPTVKVISLGIGDVTLPLAPCVVTAMRNAAEHLGTREGFVGYGDTQGLLELRDAISERYSSLGARIGADEIFISDGAKSDLGNIFDLFGNVIALICEPTYPVYADAALMSRKRVKILPCGAESSFLPSPDGLGRDPFIIFLCSPNNPTGTVLDKKSLKKWVDFALFSGSLIIFDAAYESFISGGELPRSIYEIDGAENCAIEVCSLSKMAGFTGVRCGWTVVPHACKSGGVSLHSLWARRQSTKFNGASYISQIGALAALSKEGKRQNAENIAYYMENAHLLGEFLRGRGIEYFGGAHAPYLWLKCPREMDSWGFFDHLLKKAGVVGTPGVGFGASGEGFFRFSSFARREDITEAIERMGELRS